MCVPGPKDRCEVGRGRKKGEPYPCGSGRGFQAVRMGRRPWGTGRGGVFGELLAPEAVQSCFAEIFDLNLVWRN